MAAGRTALRYFFALACATFALGSASPALAETSAQNRAAAEALFKEASQLFKDGKYEAACGKLASSQELDPAVGTLLNLGRCYEKIGKTASAWLAFSEAASAAKAANQADREGTARAGVDRLTPLLPKLLIQVPDGVMVEGLTIKRDREPVAAALWNNSSPVDPGEHVIEVSAPGKKPWSTTVRLEPSKEETVVVPALADGPAEPVKPEDKPATEGGSGLGTQRIIAIAVAGVGVASVATGSAFGAMAMSDASDAEATCSGATCTSQGGIDSTDDALKNATMSTIFLSAGAALVVGGAVLWFTAPSRKEPQRGIKSSPRVARVAPILDGTTRGLLLEGTF